MAENQFGKVSRFFLRAERKEGKTVLTDTEFTAPYKIMHPFRQSEGGLQVMLLAASAGIMEGDCQEFEFDIQSGAQIELTSQSYDKIHPMKDGCAKRQVRAMVASEGLFYFHPQPVIPFQDSSFENKMEILLEDETAGFCMSEIFSCGRYARGEKFAFRRYFSLVEIKRAGHLIYRDNTRYEPALFEMEGMGMFESCTHLLSLFLTRPDNPEEFRQQVQMLLDHKTGIQGGITLLTEGDFAIRVFACRAQLLEDIAEEIGKLIL